MKTNSDAFRIIVETVPHEVVSRLDKTDSQLRAELSGLRGMLSQVMEVIGELKNRIRDIEKRL